jgi:hypothetical protein
VPTRTKLSAALLATAAASMLSTAASADELGALKAQLEALQNRVDTMEAAPANLEGKSLLTVERGSGSNTWGQVAAKDMDSSSAERGYTIGITPTADMPAPIAEITVYGAIHMISQYTFDGDFTGGACQSFNISRLADATGDHVCLTAVRTRFGIRSRTDTAIGQIRTQIEGDFAALDGSGLRRAFRLRHGVGHWDMTPNWTFTAGQTWDTAALLPVGITTVDAAGGLLTYGFAPQVRLTYTDGPLSWAVALQNPEFETDTNMPDIASYLSYDIAGGHNLIVTGILSDIDPSASAFNADLGWAIQVGANFNLADVATLTAGFGYGEGILDSKYGAGKFTRGDVVTGDALEQMAWLVGLSFGISETTTFNVHWSGFDNTGTSGAVGGIATDNYQKVTANILWQPVRQMRLGWEVNWGEYETEAGVEEDGFGVAFGAFFFF